MTRSELIVALDMPAEQALEFACMYLEPDQCKVKIGPVAFLDGGPQLIKTFRLLGFEVFLDLKFHDIPSTVAGGVRRAADLGVWGLTLHSQGGVAMMEAANRALDNYANIRPKLIAVTALTSQSGDVCAEVYASAYLAAASGMDGVVCSPLEARSVSVFVNPGMEIVTPGIRGVGVDEDDQARSATPDFAIKQGATQLVVGRPITKAREPALAFKYFHDAITRNS